MCLDFCNTGQEAREHPGEEWITSFGDLIDWLEAADALTHKQASTLRAEGERSPKGARELWTRAIALREALARVLIARAEGRRVPKEDLELLSAEYARTAPCARLRASETGFEWEISNDELDAALRPIVESAVALLTSERLARLRRCGNATCYWLFVDETKNASRRWCEMASCGNLMKVRRHRARREKDADRNA